MAVSRTSRISESVVEKSGVAASQRARIYKYIQSHNGCTRNDIAREFHMETATVAARVNHMLEVTKVIKRGTAEQCVIDSITNKFNETLWLNDARRI